MSQSFVGEIRCFGFNFAPVSWARCDGRTLPIAQYEALFAIVGTTYGGDGTTNFQVPNLQGCVPMHWGSPTSGPAQGLNTVIGQTLGQTRVTLTVAETPQHQHTITATEVASGGVAEKTPAPNPNAWLATSNPDGLYTPAPVTIAASFSPKTLTFVGGGQPHENMQPYLALNYCICLFGIFPSQN